MSLLQRQKFRMLRALLVYHYLCEEDEAARIQARRNENSSDSDTSISSINESADENADGNNTSAPFPDGKRRAIPSESSPILSVACKRKRRQYRNRAACKRRLRLDGVADARTRASAVTKVNSDYQQNNVNSKADDEYELLVGLCKQTVTFSEDARYRFRVRMMEVLLEFMKDAQTRAITSAVTKMNPGYQQNNVNSKAGDEYELLVGLCKQTLTFSEEARYRFRFKMLEGLAELVEEK